MNINERLKTLPKYEKEFYKKKQNQKKLYLKDGKCFYQTALHYTYEMEMYQVLYEFKIFVNLEFKYHSRQGTDENGNAIFVRMPFQDVARLIYEEIIDKKELYPLCSQLTYNRFKKGFEAYTIFLTNASLVLSQNKEQTDVKMEKSFLIENSFEDFYKNYNVEEVEND